ncbi:Armadillo repeat-containing protein 8 [Zancudomyces culisetae]|uniref:Armadillo repeat-containing protein 8 n=1 Tax=Zancudomyces culisetae TaxID=1213189 RepID=A0A1R1PZF8_ZANCU|nr:Armadillo repeat-containing protein 8 [Zancudomyces culisetae]|eukprot:OMH86319.1 Armadillo repeat-containing protein 8 [Zancudomyces culisetae]
MHDLECFRYIEKKGYCSGIFKELVRVLVGGKHQKRKIDTTSVEEDIKSDNRVKVRISADIETGVENETKEEEDVEPETIPADLKLKQLSLQAIDSYLGNNKRKEFGIDINDYNTVKYGQRDINTEYGEGEEVQEGENWAACGDAMSDFESESDEIIEFVVENIRKNTLDKKKLKRKRRISSKGVWARSYFDGNRSSISSNSSAGSVGSTGSSSSGIWSESGKVEEQRLLIYSISVIGKLCTSKQRQMYFMDLGIVDMLQLLLEQQKPQHSRYEQEEGSQVEVGGIGHRRIEQVILDTFSDLVNENKMVAEWFFCTSNRIHSVIERTKSDNYDVQSAACRLLAKLSKVCPNTRYLHQVAISVVPVISNTLTSKGSEDRLLKEVQTLGLLCHSNEYMQITAYEARLIQKLVDVMQQAEQAQQSDFVDYSRSVSLQYYTLLTIAELISTREEIRAAISQEDAMFDVIERGMQHTQNQIRAAACLCARYLARSTKVLRTRFPDTKILTLLMQLIDTDPDANVRLMASSTLPNLVLDYSPMRQDAIENGLVNKLLRLLDSNNYLLVKNALWTFKNMSSMAEFEIKQNILRSVGSERLYSYLTDCSRIPIQEQAANLLRNIACSNEADIELVVHCYGVSRLRGLLKTLTSSTSEHVLTHGLYTMTNIAIGTFAHKMVIAGDDQLLTTIVSMLDPANSSEIKIATLWCVTNLAWNDDGDSFFSTENTNQAQAQSQAQAQTQILGQGQGLSTSDFESVDSTTFDNSDGTNGTSYLISILKNYHIDKKTEALIKDKDLEVRDRAMVAFGMF